MAYNKALSNCDIFMHLSAVVQIDFIWLSVDPSKTHIFCMRERERERERDIAYRQTDRENGC